MDQQKLTKSEWVSIEVPVSAEEKRINELIIEGFHDVNLQRNTNQSLLAYMKIPFSEVVDKYLYAQYLQKRILDMKCASTIKTILIQQSTVSDASGNVLKKADMYRINNTNNQLAKNIDNIYEFILLALFEKMLQEYSKQIYNSYYTLRIMLTYKVNLVNQTLIKVLRAILSHVEPEVKAINLIYNGQLLIEQNPYLLKYADETLYEHQKKLFTICKQPNPKLIMYIAPTGTGKTLSPLGLTEKFKVIFVCAARHVGLALAKSAISSHKKIAFAFGCNDAEDIRLHYFSAKEYTVNKKSGGIDKVDNSVGDKVELIISDVQSYLPAMYYMLAFNKKEDIILYWDEPTITLDYTEHGLHKTIKENWTKNLIPNVVLSSATLPQREELLETINDFCGKFAGAEVHDIVSYDCKKTIPLINLEGFVEMPHYLSEDYAETQGYVKHCQIYKTLLRYLDLGEAIGFIKYITTHDSVCTEDDKYINNERLTIDNQFSTFEDINMINIKLYYLQLLGNIRPNKWSTIYNELLTKRVKKQETNINIVTKDAHTLTDGPTIFLTNDAEKIAKFCIQSAGIPAHVTMDIMKSIDFNYQLNAKIAKESKEFEDGTKKDEGKENKSASSDRMNPEMKQKLLYIQQLQTAIKLIVLPPQFVPNTTEHLYKHAPHIYKDYDNVKNKPFTSNVSEDYVEKIMRIDDVEDYWKLLLMMGIGVFAEHKSIRYTELMKSLAQEQKLYLIIATSDYIYGTNYQFCHGYISKDLHYMSQEKCIQAMGRVGRNKLQHDYSIRFRSDTLISTLFKPSDYKPEVLNMKLLFNDSVSI